MKYYELREFGDDSVVEHFPHGSSFIPRALYSSCFNIFSFYCLRYVVY